MSKSNKKLLLTTLMVTALLIISIPITNTKVEAKNTVKIGVNQTASDSIYGIVMNMYSDGVLEYQFGYTRTVLTMSFNSSLSPLYSDLLLIKLEIEIGSYISITIKFKGNRKNDANYLNYAKQIKNNITTLLNKTGIYQANEGSTVTYYDFLNETIVTYLYNYNGSTNPIPNLIQFTQLATGNDYSSFLNLGSQWETKSYTIAYEIKPSEDGIGEQLEFDALYRNAFTGSGNHTFSFKQLTGFTEIPPIPGDTIVYGISINVLGTVYPDTITVGAGNSYILQNNQLSISIFNTAINDITFVFNYDFQTTTGGGGDTGGGTGGDTDTGTGGDTSTGGDETSNENVEGTEGGFSLSQNSLYIAIGALALIGIASVFLLRKK